MGFIYYIMEKITVWVFGGVNLNLCRSIDLIKSCFGLAKGFQKNPKKNLGAPRLVSNRL